MFCMKRQKRLQNQRHSTYRRQHHSQIHRLFWTCEQQVLLCYRTAIHRSTRPNQGHVTAACHHVRPTPFLVLRMPAVPPSSTPVLLRTCATKTTTRVIKFNLNRLLVNGFYSFHFFTNITYFYITLLFNKTQNAYRSATEMGDFKKTEKERGKKCCMKIYRTFQLPSIEFPKEFNL